MNAQLQTENLPTPLKSLFRRPKRKNFTTRLPCLAPTRNLPKSGSPLPHKQRLLSVANSCGFWNDCRRDERCERCPQTFVEAITGFKIPQRTSRALRTGAGILTPGFREAHKIAFSASGSARSIPDRFSFADAVAPSPVAGFRASKSTNGFKFV